MIFRTRGQLWDVLDFSVVPLILGIFLCICTPLHCIVFIHFNSASHSMSLSEALPTTAIDSVSEFTRASALHAIASEGLAQGPYVPARARFKPAILRSKDTDSTNAPPRPTLLIVSLLLSSKPTLWFAFKITCHHIRKYLALKFIGYFIVPLSNVKEDLAAQGMNTREAVDNSRNTVEGSGEVLLRPRRRWPSDGREKR